MKSDFSSRLKGLADWIGLSSNKYERNEAAHRNMIIVAFGSVAVALFAAMIFICLVADIPCPVGGLQDAIRIDHEKVPRYLGTSFVAIVLMVVSFAYAFSYLRKKKESPFMALFVTFMFSFTTVVLWGIAESGLAIEKQLLIFASIQFLTAGLIVFPPVGSLAYFIFSFSMFAMMLEISVKDSTVGAGDIVYLAVLDVAVSWIVYSLHRRGVSREASIADKSRRDELTGAKNRHYLRDDLETLLGGDYFVMFCDIDDFKHYNDDYSHDLGDSLLKEFYFALRESYGDECTYRYGGDEFLVVSPEFSEGDFLKKADKCTRQLKRVEIAGIDFDITFSGGYVHGHLDDEESFRRLLHEADARLMEGKRLGKNRIVGIESGA